MNEFTCMNIMLNVEHCRVSLDKVGECVINKLGTVVVEMSWCESYVDVCIVGWWLLSVLSCCMLIYTVGV